MTPDANGEAQAANTAVPSAPRSPQTQGLRPFAPGQNSHTGEVHRRGPDRKPRKLVRLVIGHALAMAQKRGREMVRGAAFGDMVVCFQKLYRGERLPNTRGFIEAVKLTKEVFDDAEDAGVGQRITRFVFPSEIEAEMKAGGALKPGEQRSPEPPRGPLAGFEEIEEPGD